MRRALPLGALVAFALLGTGGPAASARLQPGDFRYLGAFRLPGGEERPATFAYGGNAMAYRPDGDAGGADDGFPGSLFITGHDRMAYGELPNGSQVAEVTIPSARRARRPHDLPRAEFLQPFHEVDGGLFEGLDEIPRIGLAYLAHPAAGAKLHLAWGQHFQEEPRPSHALLDPDLAHPATRGAWRIAGVSPYSANGYLFELPEAWAAAHTRGRRLATGRYRDGGWGGKGPAVFAYTPWLDRSGALPPPGAELPASPLLHYEDVREHPSPTRRALRGYQHPDSWEGGAWIETPDGRSAMALAGTKGTGAKYWYGWIHPGGPELPCVETALVEQFTTCRLADGAPCPAADLGGCEGHSDYRGWWSSRFDAQILLYDPADLAAVAAGKQPAYAPQPYAVVDLDEHLLLNPDRVEADMLGTGPQQRIRVGPIAYDPARGHLYLIEPFADGAKPVVHVFAVGSPG